MMRNLYIENTGEHPAPEQEKLRKSILHSLIYFDIFNYPLTANEIAQFSSVKINGLQSITNTLVELTQKLLIFKYDEFYSLKNDLSIVERRKKGNRNALNVLPKALNRSKLIQRFPFVRSVNISGSLSKNYFDDTTDFDFFVITAPNRLWISRLLLTIYKKIFLLNSRKYFCINYYVDTDYLTIPDKNLFSATEIVTLKNQTGENYYRTFIQENNWIDTYFPNFYPQYNWLEEEKNGLIKRFIENLFAGRLGDIIDTFAFKLTTKFLKSKYVFFKSEDFKTNFRTKKHVSKHHPQGFQFKVLNAFEQKCRDFELQHSTEL